MLYPSQTINCRGKLLSLEKPIVMGVLNVTPDSFYDGGKYRKSGEILQQTEQMLAEGASIIDVGGMSSRPGAEVTSLEEELKRVIPAIESIHQNFPDAIVSVDTIRAKVAKEAVEAGASVVNDISAGSMDEALYQTVAALGVPYILMHMRGNPKTMQLNPDYEDVVQEVLDFLIQEVGKLRALGIKDLIVDVGFGFGKTIEQNYRLLKNIPAFQILDLPILVGISRKSMIYKLLKITPQEALNGTSVLNLLALQQGAKLLRVHDVKEARQVIQLWEQYNEV